MFDVLGIFGVRKGFYVGIKSRRHFSLIKYEKRVIGTF
jgi:hypothetical protein